jgi:hypothetical protein
MSSLGHFSARSAATGEKLWEHDIQEEFESPLPNWAFSTSALVVGNSVVVEIGGTEDRTVSSFDRADGMLQWTAGSGEIAFSSPILVPFNGVTQLVFLTKNGLAAVTSEGKPLWSSDFAPELGIKPAPPVFIAPDLIFASASYDAGAKVVRMVADGDGTRVETVWEHQLMRNHFNGSVEVDGHLCGFDKAFLKCVGASTGDTSWTKRGLGKGSLIRADGKLIALSERGKLVLMEANANEPIELASHQVLTGRSWTQPALSNGRLYVRNGSEIVALDLSDRTSDLVDRFTEAMGGIEAMRALQSIRKTGNYVYNGLEHPIVVRQRRGTGSREDVEGLTTWGTETVRGTTAIRAFDGKHAWTGQRGETLETRAMPEGESVGFILDADIEGSLIDYSAKGNTVEVVGSATVEGTPAVQVAVTMPNGTSEQWYLDASSLLPLMKTTEVADSEYKAAMTWYFDDYREVGGVQMPYYVLVEERLFSREYLFDSIEVNVEIDQALFTQPEGTQVEQEP